MMVYFFILIPGIVSLLNYSSCFRRNFKFAKVREYLTCNNNNKEKKIVLSMDERRDSSIEIKSDRVIITPNNNNDKEILLIESELDEKFVRGYTDY